MSEYMKLLLNYSISFICPPIEKLKESWKKRSMINSLIKEK